MSDEPKEPDAVKAFTDKLHNEFLPKLAHPKGSQRNTMAITMLAIVDRQILHKETDTAKEWEKLRETVKDNPPALAMVVNLEGVLQKYEGDLQKQIRAGLDEEHLRRTASGLIKMAIMSKMRKANPGEATAGWGTADLPVPAAAKPVAVTRPVAVTKPVAGARPVAVAKPAAKKPVAKKPAAKKAVAKKAAAKKVAAKKPAAKKPAAKKPAVKKRAAKKPARAKRKR